MNTSQHKNSSLGLSHSDMRELENLHATSQFNSLENRVRQLVNKYPEKVKSLGFDKMDEIYGMLWGIKGQYLIFDDGSVLNIRKHNGYNVSLEV